MRVMHQQVPGYTCYVRGSYCIPMPNLLASFALKEPLTYQAVPQELGLVAFIFIAKDASLDRAATVGALMTLICRSRCRAFDLTSCLTLVVAPWCKVTGLCMKSERTNSLLIQVVE